MNGSAPGQALERSAPAPAQPASPEALRRTRTLRYGLGVTAGAAIAFGFRWPLFYVTPLLVAVFLALPLPGPTSRQAVGLFVAILVAFALGLIFALFLLPYPLVFVPLLGLTLFNIYYGVNRGGSPILAIMALLALLILPMVSLNEATLASGVMLYFVASAGLAVFIYLVAHAIIPDPGAPVAAAPARPFHSGYVPQAAVAAVKSTLSVLLVAVLFLSMNWASELLVMVFVAIFSLSPQASESGAEGLKSLVSNLIGGAAAIVFYWLVVAVKDYHFFIMLMLLTALVFGSAIFSPRPWAKYMPAAGIALLVLIGGSMSGSADFMDTLVIRIVLISLAVLYVVTAMTMLDWLFARWESHRSRAQRL